MSFWIIIVRADNKEAYEASRIRCMASSGEAHTLIEFIGAGPPFRVSSNLESIIKWMKVDSDCANYLYLHEDNEG